MEKLWPKTAWGVRVYVIIQFQMLVYIAGKSPRDSSRARDWRWGPKQKPWKNTASWLVSHDLAYFLIKHKITFPHMAAPTLGWSLQHQSLIEKMSLKLPAVQSYEGILSINFTSLFSDRERITLGQIHSKLARTFCFRMARYFSNVECLTKVENI